MSGSQNIVCVSPVPVKGPVSIEKEDLLHHHYDAQLGEQSRRGRQRDHVLLRQTIEVNVQPAEEVLRDAADQQLVETDQRNQLEKPLHAQRCIGARLDLVPGNCAPFSILKKQT